MENFLQRVAFPAIHAEDPAHVAVELEYLCRIVSRFLVEIVDVLGDDAAYLSQLLQLRDGLMRGVGPGLLEQIAGEEEAPLFPPGLRARQKFIDREILRIEFRPEAAGAAEIGNPGFRADARARKNNDVFRLRNHFRDPADLFFLLPIYHFSSVFRGHVPIPPGRGHLAARCPHMSRIPPGAISIVQHYSRTLWK